MRGLQTLKTLQTNESIAVTEGTRRSETRRTASSSTSTRSRPHPPPWVALPAILTPRRVLENSCEFESSLARHSWPARRGRYNRQHARCLVYVSGLAVSLSHTHLGCVTRHSIVFFPLTVSVCSIFFFVVVRRCPSIPPCAS